MSHKTIGMTPFAMRTLHRSIKLSASATQARPLAEKKLTLEENRSHRQYAARSTKCQSVLLFRRSSPGWRNGIRGGLKIPSDLQAATDGSG